MDRLIPPIRFFLILQSVKTALINIPPMAIGRTMNRQTSVAWALHSCSPASAPRVVSNEGPRKYNRSGTNRPHASKPPAKFSDASLGPIMYPTPMYAGLTPGVERTIPPLPDTVLPPFPSRIPPLLNGMNFSHDAANSLSCLND